MGPAPRGLLRAEARLSAQPDSDWPMSPPTAAVVSRTGVGPALCGLFPTPTLPSALPDSDWPKPAPTAAVVSRTAVGTAPRGFFSCSSDSCLCWALPYSSTVASATGLRSAVVLHLLGHHAPHGVHHGRTCLCSNTSCSSRFHRRICYLEIWCSS